LAKHSRDWRFAAALLAGFVAARVHAKPRPPVTPCEIAHFEFMQAFAKVKQTKQQCKVDNDCLTFTYPYPISSCPDKRFVSKHYHASKLQKLTQAVTDNCKPLSPGPPTTCVDARVPVCDPATHECAGLAPAPTP
jgi:hypothetical protein